MTQKASNVSPSTRGLGTSSTISQISFIFHFLTFSKVNLKKKYFNEIFIL